MKNNVVVQIFWPHYC